MNARKLRQLKYVGGRFLLLFTALLIITGLLITQTPGKVVASMRSDPDDFEPIGGVGGDPPAYVAPTNGFTWSIEKRYGPLGDDGMIETHWIVGEMKYEQSYIYPANWRVDFNACLTENDHSNGAVPDYY